VVGFASAHASRHEDAADDVGEVQAIYEAAGLRPDGAVKVDDSRGFALSEVRYRRSLP